MGRLSTTECTYLPTYLPCTHPPWWPPAGLRQGTRCVYPLCAVIQGGGQGPTQRLGQGVKKGQGPKCSAFRSPENSSENASGRATGPAEHPGPLVPF